MPAAMSAAAVRMKEKSGLPLGLKKPLSEASCSDKLSPQHACAGFYRTPFLAQGVMQAFNWETRLIQSFP